MPKGLRYTFYFFIFCVSYVFFVYWLFPMDSLRNRLIGTIEKQLGSPYSVKIRNLDTYRITGIEVNKLELLKSMPDGDVPVLKADLVQVRAGLLSLLTGNPKLFFHVKSGRLRFDGDVYRGEPGWWLDTRIKNLDIGQMGLKDSLHGLDFSSNISGDVKLQLDPNQPMRTVGKIQLDLESLSLAESELNLGEMGSLKIPPLALAGPGSVMQMTLDKGALNVESLKLKGEDFGLDLTGRIFLAQSASRFRLNLQGKFFLGQKLWGLVEPLLPENILAEIKKQKGPDEYLPISVSGQLGAPQVYCGTLSLYPFKPF